MRNVYTVLCLGVFALGCAANPNQRDIVTVGELRCVSPPPDVVTTAREAQVS